MKLNEIMEFDHVIRVHEDGSVTDEPNIYAPDLMDGELQSDKWEFFTTGYSGQGIDRSWMAKNPIMHNSEYIGLTIAIHERGSDRLTRWSTPNTWPTSIRDGIPTSTQSRPRCWRALGRRLLRRTSMNADAIELLERWIKAELFVISETGSSRDWEPLIEEAKGFASRLSIEWNDNFIPDYVWEMKELMKDYDPKSG